MNRILASTLLTFLMACTPLRAVDQTGDFPKADSAAIAHWQSLRFGMFIHWGPASLTEKEISWSRGSGEHAAMYDNLYKQFNPVMFNADDWVTLAKKAGVKYIVHVAKHHDGFCMWDTKYTDYNIMNTPFHRDIVKELSEACKKQGIAFGVYYSPPDVHSPDWPYSIVGGGGPRQKYDMDAYATYLQNQTSELIKNYGPLITIWNDTDTGFPGVYGKHGADTIKLGRKLQPDILFCNRTGDGGDYLTPEQTVGAFDMDHPWESCITVSAHNQWSWGGPGDGVKSLSTCIETLVRCAGGDGNMLLNIGPRPDGIIDPAQAELLEKIGSWLAIYGESIYGTRGGPYKPSPRYASTRKENVIYLHILDPKDGTVTLPQLPAEIVSSSVLGGGEVEVNNTDDGLIVHLLKADPSRVDTIVKLTIKGSAMDLGVIHSLGTATASNVFQNRDDYSAEKAFDGDPTTRWATDDGVKSAWVQIDFPKARQVNSVSIDEWGNRVSNFAVEYRESADWKPILTGTTIGSAFKQSFPPVTAKSFRLNILDSSGGPTINEIRLSNSTSDPGK